MTTAPTYFLVALALIAFVSCGDDDGDATAAPDNGQAVDPIGALERGAVLVTASVSTAPPVTVPGVPEFDVTLDIPVAAFYVGGNLVDVGEVSIDGQALGQQGNTYTVTADFANPSATVIDYTDRNWTVAGGGDVPALDVRPTRPQPTLGTVTAETEIAAGTPYTMSVASISSADSVYYILGGVVKRFGAGTRSVTFSADEVGRAQTSAGSTVAQVAAFNTEQRDVGGFPVFLIGQAVNNKIVTIN